MQIVLVGAELEENLAVRYIQSALEQAAHEVSIVVFNAMRDLESAARQIADSQAELVGFSMVFTYRAHEFARLAMRARELGFAGRMVAGGHFATLNARALLSDVPAFDFVACGEGEYLLQDLAAHLDDPAQVRGLVWRDNTGQIIENAPAEKPADLDLLPPPVRKKPYDLFFNLPVVNMLSSRGCTHACVFCSIAAWHKHCGGARFRLRDPRHVAEEMAELYHDGVRIFNFHDDNFFLQNTEQMFDRMQILEAELKRRDVGQIAFAVKARPDSVDGELFAYLKRLGLFRVFLGIEAGTSRQLTKLGREQSLEQNKNAIKILNGLEIHTCFNLLLLGPDSTLEDFQENVDFLRQHPSNPMNFCRTEIYAGTPLEAKLRKEERLLDDYWGYDYRMSDPHVQRVFEAMYTTMEERNRRGDCLHHLTMELDYLLQLREDFEGSTPDLRRRVKDFVRQVNLNTCDYLDEIARMADDPSFDNQERMATFERDLHTRMVQDQQRLQESGATLRDELWETELAHKIIPPTHWKRYAATTAATVAIATLAVGCNKAGDTKGSTPAKNPPPHPQVCEWAPPPILVPNDNGLLEKELKGIYLPRIIPKILVPTEVVVTSFLERNASGTVSIWSSNVATTGTQTIDLHQENLKSIPLVHATSTTLGVSSNVRVTLTFSQEEIAKAQQKYLKDQQGEKEKVKPTASPTPRKAPTIIHEWAAVPPERHSQPEAHPGANSTSIEKTTK